MVISHTTHLELLDPLWKAIFYQRLEEAKKRNPIPVFYSEETSGRAKEKIIGMGGLPPTPRFTGVVSFAAPRMLHAKETDFPEFVQGVEITQKMLEDVEHREAVDLFQLLAEAYVKRQHIDALANMFNFAITGPGADSPQYLAPDGLPLVSASHTWRTGGPPQSNRVTMAFSGAAVEEALARFRGFVDDTGHSLFTAPNICVLPTGLLIAGQRLFGSRQGPDTPNLGENILGGDYNRLLMMETAAQIKILWSPLLADQTAAFLISTEVTKAQKGLMWFQRIQPELTATVGGNAHTRVYTLRARHGLLMKHPFWVVGIRPA